VRSPLAAPIYADLAGLAPLLIQLGAAETLLDDAIRLAKVAGAAALPEDAAVVCGPSSQRTLSWREMDSNPRSRFTCSPLRDPLLSAP
jgi:acetyl esterase/lipase